MIRKFLLHIKEYFRWYLLGFLLIISALLWHSAIRENRNGLLTVTFLNIGQGDAIFIESPTGTQVIFDGGPDKSLMREISAVLPWYDRHIDMLVNTNSDKDHYFGFIPLLDKYKTDVFMESGAKTPSVEFSYLKEKLKIKNVPDLLAQRGEVIDLGGGVYITILFPNRDVSGLSTNDASIVAKLSYGETSLMLQGDSTSKMEKYILTLPGDLSTDILKAGHHGSKTSTSPEYVKAVSPQYAIISAGKNNPYGHPHQETVDTLTKAKTQILATCSMGQITFQSDGKNFILKNKNVVPVLVGCK